MFTPIFLVLALLNCYYAGHGITEYAHTGNSVTLVIAGINFVLGVLSWRWFFQALED